MGTKEQRVDLMSKAELLFQLLESVDPKLVHLARKAAMATVDMECSRDQTGAAPRGKKVKNTLAFKKYNEYAKGLAMGDDSIADIYNKAYREAKRSGNEQGK
jgi:hypothetical protein